jgi:hypothetical protein
MKPNSSIPGLLALFVLALAVLAIILLGGCASTTFYVDGKRFARMEGDMTEVVFIRKPNGDLHFTAETVDHSSATLASGKTMAGAITASGAATTSVLLTQ